MDLISFINDHMIEVFEYLIINVRPFVARNYQRGRVKREWCVSVSFLIIQIGL